MILLSRDPGRRPAGVTLIEVLVATSVVGVLLALSLGALGRASREAKRAQCLTTLRGCGFGVLRYADEHREAFPCIGRADPFSSFENGGMTFNYYDQSYYWPMAMDDVVRGRADLSRTCPSRPNVRDPDYRGGPGWPYPASFVLPVSYYLMYGAFTRAELWRDGESARDIRWLRGSKVSEVLSPGSKGMLIEPRVYHAMGGRPATDPSISMFRNEGRGQFYPTMFVDGHAETVAYPRFRRGVRRVAGDDRASDGVPVLTTVDGVRGRDL